MSEWPDSGRPTSLIGPASGSPMTAYRMVMLDPTRMGWSKKLATGLEACCRSTVGRAQGSCGAQSRNDEEAML